MPSCVAGGPAADTDAAEKLRRATLETMQREQLIEMRRALDKLHDLPMVDKRDLEGLSMSCGPMLDVDDFDPASPTQHQSRFFMPCTWSQDDLEYESWSDMPWRSLDRKDPYASSNLAFPLQRSEWFQHRLDALGRCCPDIWDTYCDDHVMVRQIGLHLPSREFFRRGLHIYHEYYSMWASLAHLDTDKPHAQCCMVDSADKVTDDILLRSEVETALAMCHYQLCHGYFVNHHTKPILISTIMRDQKARLTEAYLDAKLNKLLIRQSRLLDLSGASPGPDAWLMLRWMATAPVGLTKYPEGAHTASLYTEDMGSFNSSVVV